VGVWGFLVSFLLVEETTTSQEAIQISKVYLKVENF